MPHLELPDLPDRLPCLTLWPEWVYGIIALGKDIENRGPWLSERLRRYQGQYIGIHAGKNIGGKSGSGVSDYSAVRLVIETASDAGYRFSKRRFEDLAVPERGKIIDGAIQATRALASSIAVVVRLGAPLPTSYPPRMEGWHATNQIGWSLKEVLVLPRPVLCKGMQGLWFASAEQTRAIREQIASR